jgi:hypothetical protein
MQNFKGQTYTEKTAIAPPPLNLETGRLEWRSMLILEGSGFGGVALAFLFIQFGAASWCSAASYDCSSWRNIFGGGAWMIGALLLVVGLYMIALPLRREQQHNRRVNQYSDQHLAERKRVSGVVTERSFSQFEYRANRADHMLVLALWAYRTGKVTVQDFRSPIFIGGRRIADGLVENDARAVPNILASLGIIEGRTNGVAGHIAADVTADDILDLVWDNADRIDQAGRNPAVIGE